MRDDRVRVGGETMNQRRHDTPFPGFTERAERRRALTGQLAAKRQSIGLTQTEVAARMGTSQSAVARLESGDADIRLSTLERYAAALGHQLNITLKKEQP
jgi:ribosome-binding protein aMBF1 (putative translation factor)